MLKGFTVPRTPRGVAALAPPPPWHFAGDVLAVEFWNDQDAAAESLPGGIELDPSRAGRSVALFADFQFTAQADEYLDPARYQCREFIVLLDAMWQGAEMAWCPYAYVDNDAALARGWIQGYPQKIGVVHQTRTFAVAGAASAPLVRGCRLAASASTHGRLLAQARVTLRDRVDQLAGLLDRPIVARRHFPRLSAGLHDKPVVDELVCCRMHDVLTTNIWVGDADLVFPEAHGEEIEMLGPIKIGRGFRFSFSCSVSDSEVLMDLTTDGRR
ncbi:acetoacetate decarboxylase family protein [Bradyrhizobium iriomotense]|uniref:Acetoacetate decarboxylase n=1 Tax=Bradyrhizobium iriomotense TaxID=441950 RepID=A0ABQ6AMX6_9BRAD|nr:acetoacetate decarboxylase family protein [Bradyrhizobium iriomotense]GLR83593.1 acetoacetate decarboxylase [Bradyrhizobium iriomotense]